LNQELYPKNTYGETSADKLVTLYIPRSLEGKVEDVKNNVIAENFAFVGVDPEQFQVNIIPDHQETFLLNYGEIQAGLYSSYLPKQQMARDKILVQLNYQKVPYQSDNPLRLMGPNIDPYGKALIRRNVLLEKLKAQDLQNQLLRTVNESADASLLAHTINGQLQGVLMVTVGVIVSSVFILWEYLKNQYQRAAKTLVVTYLFSGNSHRQELQLLYPLLAGVGLSALISALISKSILVFGFILVLYLLEILVVVIINRRQLETKRIQVIKDALE
jgi:hypothetical protein